MSEAVLVRALALALPPASDRTMRFAVGAPLWPEGGPRVGIK